MVIASVSLPQRERWLKLFTQFFSGQVVVQGVNFLTGFLLLRWLSVTAYAQFSVAFAFQCTLGMLIDLGFSNSIVALVGDRRADANLIGSYIRSAKHFRNRMFVVMIGVSAVAFPIMTRSQPWSVSTKLWLFGAIASALFFQGWGMYAVPLLIHRRLDLYYRAQIIPAVARITICFLLYVLGVLSAAAVAWSAAVVLAVSGILYRRAAVDLVCEPKRNDPEVYREIARFVSPLILPLVFTAFQGQISVGILTLFGKTQSIAEIAALGRLGQIFTIFYAANAVIIEPYIASVSRERLLTRYLQIFLGVILLSTMLTLTAFLFPQAYLWLLGANYQHLQAEVGWIVLSSALYYIAVMLWAMNSARKWRYWWFTTLEVGLAVATQIACVIVMDVSQLHNVIAMSIITNTVLALAHIIFGLYNLVRCRSSLRQHPPAVQIEL